MHKRRGEYTYQQVTRYTNSTFGDTARFEDSLDTNLELRNIVESIEDTEDINTVLLCLLAEVVDGIVRERRVGNTVGSTEKHLERNVGYELPHLPQPVPGILVEEAHGHVEGGSTPALERPGVGVGVAGLLGDAQEINSADAGGEERLVSIAPCGVHDQCTLVCADRLGEGLRALLDEDVTPALGGGGRRIDLVAVLVDDVGNPDLALELGLADLSLDLAAVDSKLTEVGEQLLGTVLGTDEVEKGGGVVDEGGPALSVDEGRVCEKLEKEGNVGLYTTDTELDEGTKHLSSNNLVCGATARALDQHGVVVGGDDGTGETVTSVETHSIATCVVSEKEFI